jgi:GAF domain-containing protein
MLPERRIASVEAFASALGASLEGGEGSSLSITAPDAAQSRSLLEAVVRTAAGVFHAASASIALLDAASGELIYKAAWGAGASEIVGVRLAQEEGIGGAVARSGQAEVVPDCKSDTRFAAQIASGTGYVPNTMIVVPLRSKGETVGVLSVLDRRDGGSYGAEDVVRAGLFAELAVTTLDQDG